MTQIVSENTQTRLLRAAASLMWERSFQATSVDELCQRAEAKKGSFYHFFDSKTDLAIAAMEQSWREIKQRFFKPVFSSDLGGLEQLQKLVETMHAFQMQAREEKGEYLGCPFGNLGQEMARQDERLRQTLDNIFHEHYDYIEGALKKAIQDGDIAPGNTRQRAQRIFALLEGAMLLAKVGNDPAIFRDVGPALMVVAAN